MNPWEDPGQAGSLKGIEGSWGPWEAMRLRASAAHLPCFLTAQTQLQSLCGWTCRLGDVSTNLHFPFCALLSSEAWSCVAQADLGM